MNKIFLTLTVFFCSLLFGCKEETPASSSKVPQWLEPTWGLATVCQQTLIEIGVARHHEQIYCWIRPYHSSLPEKTFIKIGSQIIPQIEANSQLIFLSIPTSSLAENSELSITFPPYEPLTSVTIPCQTILSQASQQHHCDDPECDCHEHECDDPECDCHEHECDDPECDCHEHECDDPECDCHEHKE